MGDIKFEFNLDKLIHAIAFFCAKGIQDLTKLKVAKLLYFADKKHLLEHGEPILGDVGRVNGPSLGLRYDVSEFAAFKLQYDRTGRRALEPFNGLTLQLAFTF